MTFRATTPKCCLRAVLRGLNNQALRIGFSRFLAGPLRVWLTCAHAERAGRQMGSCSPTPTIEVFALQTQTERNPGLWLLLAGSLLHLDGLRMARHCASIFMTPKSILEDCGRFLRTATIPMRYSLTGLQVPRRAVAYGHRMGNTSFSRVPAMGQRRSGYDPNTQASSEINLPRTRA